MLFARAPRPDAWSAGLPYTWRFYLAPLWHEETGAPLWRPTPHGRVVRWDPPTRWHLRPCRRLSLFERERAAGRPHAVGVNWSGQVWDNNPARQPPLDPEPWATGREVAAEVHALLPRLTDLWWAALLEPGEVWATAPWPDVLRRIHPGPHRARGYPGGRPPCRGVGARLSPASTCPPPPPAACRWWIAASFHAASPASRRAHLGPVTSADRLTSVQRARLAQEGWLTFRHVMLPPL